MYNTNGMGMSHDLIESLEKKWGKLLDHKDAPKINGSLRRGVTAILLENQERWNRGLIKEDAPPNFSGGLGSGTNVGSFDPIMISLVRRAAPLMIAYDVAGVQPMTGPTGLVFAMKAKYKDDSDGVLTDDPEALFDEARTWEAGAGSGGTVGTITSGDDATDPSILNDSPAGTYGVGKGMTTAELEALGTGGSSANFNEMGFTIDKVTVTAKGRGLKAEFTDELTQDLRAVHNLDAETELANILQQEILAEINRELIRNIYIIARVGAQSDTTTAGVFDLDTDSNGRWLGEKAKGLVFQIEREANQIAKQTRRGKGNILICTADIASLLAMSGDLDYSPAMQENLNVDESSTTFAGVLRNGRLKVYVDPYSTGQYFVVGYKGNNNNYDAGLFYCPYVPLQMVRAIGQDSFQPKIGFKTRYGMVTNPFANASGTAGDLVANVNKYYRRVKVTNIM